MKKIAILLMTLLITQGVFAAQSTLFDNYMKQTSSPSVKKIKKEKTYTTEDYKTSKFYFDILNKSKADFYKLTEQHKDVNLDNAFYTLQKEYEKDVFAMQHYNIDDIWSFGCDKNLDTRANKIPAVYYINNGINLTCNDGYSNYSIDWKYLRGISNMYVSDVYGIWLDYMSKNAVLMNDGEFTGEFDNIRKNIIFLENFMKENPDFVAIADVYSELERNHKYYVTLFSDTYSAFDQKTNMVREDYVESYKKFSEENKDSKYYNEVSSLYDKLKENQYAANAVFKAWYRLNFMQ